MAVASSSSGSTGNITSLDPNIWRHLPDELEQLVFAHLPLANIFQLQLLSRTWRDLIVTGNQSTVFRRACAQNHPKLFAVATEVDSVRGTLHIRAYDKKVNKWFSYDMRVTTMHNEELNYLTACDGGLLCCVSTVNRNGSLLLQIKVCNPLTREMKALPVSEVLSEVQPRMVQLVMHTDREDQKYYEVIVVGRKNGAGITRAEDSRAETLAVVYNSQAGAWSDISHSVSDLVFGYRYSQDDETLAWSLVPMVVDCQRGQHLQLNNDPWQIPLQNIVTVRKLDLVKDHLFVLDVIPTRDFFPMGPFYGSGDVVIWRCQCTLKEFRARYRDQVGNLGWVEEKDHKFSFGYWIQGYRGSVRFYACTTFLLIVFIDNNEDENQDFTRLYDLSTSKWHRIQDFPDRIAYDNAAFEDGTLCHNPNSIMCELQWDAIP